MSNNHPTPLEARKLELEAFIEAREVVIEDMAKFKLSPAAECFRSDNKFKQDNNIIPLGYTATQINYSHGFVDGYKYHCAEAMNIAQHEANQAARIAEEWLLMAEALDLIAKRNIPDNGSGLDPQSSLSLSIFADDTLSKLTRNTNQSKEKQ